MSKKYPYRELIVGVDTKVPSANGLYLPYINFDNAATTPPFVSVMNKIVEFAPWYSSIHRGTGYKSKLSSNIYDNSRQKVLDFVGGNNNLDCVIYVKNTTEAINKISNMFRKIYGKKAVLATEMEHHSNDLPWRDDFIIDYAEVDAEGKLNTADLEKKMKKYQGDLKLVTVSGASNVTGIINPIHEIAHLAHRYGAMILVDGAQLVPHSPVDMGRHTSPFHIDFLVFSAHKMYAPFGIGALVGPKSFLNYFPPDYKGGGTINMVTHDFVKWAALPDKEEAGTPNVMGVVALAEAIDVLKTIKMRNVKSYEENLTYYALKKLSKIPGIILYQSLNNAYLRVSIIPFNLENLNHGQVASILSDEFAIAVRSGCFCAQPYVQKLLNVPQEKMKERMKGLDKPYPGFVRLSFGIYNTYEEIDFLADALKTISQRKQGKRFY